MLLPRLKNKNKDILRNSPVNALFGAIFIG